MNALNLRRRSLIANALFFRARLRIMPPGQLRDHFADTLLDLRYALRALPRS